MTASTTPCSASKTPTPGLLGYLDSTGPLTVQLHTGNQMGIATCCRLLGHPGIESAPLSESITPVGPQVGRHRAPGGKRPGRHRLLATDIRRLRGMDLLKHADALHSVYTEAFCAPPWNEDEERGVEFVGRLVDNVRRPGFTAPLAFAGAETIGFATA